MGLTYVSGKKLLFGGQDEERDDIFSDGEIEIEIEEDENVYEDEDTYENAFGDLDAAT